MLLLLTTEIYFYSNIIPFICICVYNNRCFIPTSLFFFQIFLLKLLFFTIAEVIVVSLFFSQRRIFKTCFLPLQMGCFFSQKRILKPFCFSPLQRVSCCCFIPPKRIFKSLVFHHCRGVAVLSLHFLIHVCWFC